MLAMEPLQAPCVNIVSRAYPALFTMLTIIVSLLFQKMAPCA